MDNKDMVTTRKNGTKIRFYFEPFLNHKWTHFPQKKFFSQNTDFWKKHVLCQKLLMNFLFFNITFDPNNQNTSMISFWKGLWVYKIKKIQTQIFGTKFK
jgi:hypothetical protein